MASCKVCSDSGREDALEAIGICNKCGRAFCGGHASVDHWGAPVLNKCSPCADGERPKFNLAPAGGGPGTSDQMARIRELVGALGDRGLVTRTRKQRYVKWYSSRTHFRDVPIEPAWPIGDLEWWGTEVAVPRPSGITRALEIVRMDGKDDYHSMLHVGYSEARIWPKSILGYQEVQLQVIKALERLT